MTFLLFKVQVVIPRFAEDIQWTNKLDDSYELLVYNRGADLDYEIRGEIIKLSNFFFGREGHAILYHILSNYDNLTDWTVFTQADPFPHSPNFVELVNSEEFRLHRDGDERSSDGLRCFSCQYTEDVPGGGKGCRESDNMPVTYTISTRSAQVLGTTHDTGVAQFMSNHALSYGIPERYLFSTILKNAGIHGMRGTTDFCYGAIFAVHRDNILQHPKETYEKLMAEYFEGPVPDEGESPDKWNCTEEEDSWCRGKWSSGYVYERMWMRFFQFFPMNIRRLQ